MTTAAFCHIEISAAGLGQADCGCALTGHVTPSRTPNDSNQFWVPKITERCFEPNICWPNLAGDSQAKFYACLNSSKYLHLAAGILQRCHQFHSPGRHLLVLGPAKGNSFLATSSFPQMLQESLHYGSSGCGSSVPRPLHVSVCDRASESKGFGWITGSQNITDVLFRGFVKSWQSLAFSMSQLRCHVQFGRSRDWLAHGRCRF